MLSPHMIVMIRLLYNKKHDAQKTMQLLLEVV